MSDIQNQWDNFFHEAQVCCKCQNLKLVKNILANMKPSDPWGLAWYDKHRNLDGGLVLVGMDFGNEMMVNNFRAALKLNPRFEPDQSQDKSYVRLCEFLEDAGVRDRAFVTNAALCVRIGSAPITGKELPHQVYARCNIHLQKQIDLAKPYVIVPLGNIAVESVLSALRYSGSPGKITQIAGQQFVVKINQADVLVIPAIHPNRAQPNWGDNKQKNAIYRPLKQILSNKDATIGRSQFRSLFGTL